MRAFGTVRLLRDGVAVEHADLRRRRVRELLAVLVVRRQQRRDEIAELMWPDAADPRHNLRVTLGYLQRAIGPHVSLVVDHDRVRLLPNPWLRCDLWELDELLDAADSAERACDPTRTLDRYRLLLPMWSGDPFSDLGDIDWVRDEQTRHRHRYTSAAVRAGELHLAAGACREAVDAARRAIDADRFDERAHRLAMTAHLADGDLGGARVAADRCVTALAELQVGPSSETSAVIEAIAADR